MVTPNTAGDGTVQMFTDAPDSQTVDIAIIGAGVSGLYCAYRLLEQDPTRRIAVVERLNRTGGRLDSDVIEIGNDGKVREEEGGMRFNYDMHELMQLNCTLGLCDDIVPFPMKSPGNTNRFHLRGRTFTAAEAVAGGDKIWGEIYALADSEKNLSPTALVLAAYHQVLKANPDKEMPTHPEAKDWTNFRNTFEWNGDTVNQWQMWGLLRDMDYSEECIQMLSETIGFAGPFKAPINAGDAFQILADFPKDPEYYTFENGFSTLPNKLVSELNGRCSILLSTNVDQITEDDGDYTLDLTEAPDFLNSRPHIPCGVSKTIVADQVIIAAATGGMEKLFETSPALNQHRNAQQIWKAIHSARGMKLMKINLYFEKQWWAYSKDMIVNPPVVFGPNFSNLPINAVYPFYAEHDGAAGALTIYCDFNNTNFWAGLQNVGELFTSTLQEQENCKVPQTLYGASRKVVDEAKKQLASLFAIDSVPEPVLTSYRLWDAAEDFEYAYHQWRVGVDDRPVRKFLADPGDGLFFCNEAISDMHGWVNGSLRSSNLVLASFGIDPIDTGKCEKPAEAGSSAHAAESPATVTGLWGA